MAGMTRYEFARDLAVRLGLVASGASGQDGMRALQTAGVTTQNAATFRGNDEISRAEAATMFVRASGGTANSTAEGLRAAVDRGMFSSVGDGTQGFLQSWFNGAAGGIGPTQDHGLQIGQNEPASVPVAAVVDPVQAAADAETQRAAEETLSDKLTRYGLETLIAWAIAQLREGTSPEAIAVALRDQQDFKDRFKGMEFRTQNGYVAITPAQYLRTEQAFKQTLKKAGIPAGFYDTNDELASFIGNDVSAAEFTDRVALARATIGSVNPELKQQLVELYGVGASGDGELIAYFLDPNRAVDIIEQRLQVESAGLSAASVGVYGGGFDKATSRQLADANVQQREIGDRLKGQAGLVTHKLLGETGGPSSSQAAAAEFGFDSEATAQIRRLRQRRQSAGAAMSGTLATQTGAGGLGSSNTQG